MLFLYNTGKSAGKVTNGTTVLDSPFGKVVLLQQGNRIIDFHTSKYSSRAGGIANGCEIEKM